MSRKGKTTKLLGRRSVADKLWSLLGKLGPEGRPVLERELLLAAEGLARETRSDFEGEPEDAKDFLGYVRPISVATVVRWFFGGAPLGPLTSAFSVMERAEEELGSGGPPISPVHDSLQVTWTVLDVALGRAGETFASVTRSILARLSILPECVEQLRRLEAEPLGVYAVRKIEPARVGASRRYLLREIATDRELWVQFLEAYDVHPTDFVLVRPTALPADRAQARGVSHVCFTTPYVCEAESYAAWRDYFERAAGELGARLDDAAYRRVMRGEGNPRRWLDFVFEGYTGQRALNVVEVAGIPDLPHTLQHHEDFDEAQSDAIPPGAEPTTRSGILIGRTVRMMSELGSEGFPKLEPDIRVLSQDGGEDWVPMLLSIALSEGASNTGPLFDLLQKRCEFDEDLTEWASAARAGHTSLFEIVSSDPGHGVRVRDALGGQTYDLVERSGSHMLQPGMLTFGRVVFYRGVHMFDMVHTSIARAGAEKRIVDAVRSMLAGRPMRGALAVEAAKVWNEVIAAASRAAVPTLMTTTGQALVFCVIELAFRPPDHGRVRDAIGRLRRCFSVPNDEGDADEEGFEILTATEVVEARITLAKNGLRIESNATQRANNVLSRLRGKLPRVLRVVHREEVPVSEMLERMRS